MRLFVAIVVLTLLFARPTHADLEVNVRQDKVVLTDGTEIECIILVITERAVLVVETDPDDPDVRRQRTIPRRVVKSIVRGENEGVVEGLTTEVAQARKVIAGTGFRDEEREPKDKEKTTDKDKAKKDPKDKTVADIKSAKTEPKNAGPVGPGKSGIVFSGKAAKLATETVAGNIKGPPRDMAEAYLQRFPALRDAAQSFLGADRLPQTFEQIQKGDGQTRTQAESFLKVFMGSDTSALGQTMVLGAGGGTVRPGRERTPRRPRERPAQ